MSDDKAYLHQSIAQAVRDHDIDTMFGLVGDANLFWPTILSAPVVGKWFLQPTKVGLCLWRLPTRKLREKSGLQQLLRVPAWRIALPRSGKAW